MDGARTILTGIFRAALAAVAPGRGVQRECPGINDRFWTGGFERLLVIGFGKGAGPMALAIEENLGDLPMDGVIVTPYGHRGERGLQKIRLLEAGHPIPDENGIRAAREIIRMAERADAATLAVVLISGGGSALLVSPAPGVTLRDKQRTTELLLRSGADIREVNAVRKHLSRVKGGRLAELLHPATSVSLMLSDVLGDPLDVIASGPTVPDPSTFGDALAVLARYRLEDRVPPQVVRRLVRGIEGRIQETPKPGGEVFRATESRIVGSLGIALDGARSKAAAAGLKTELVSRGISGEARDAGRMLARRALEARREKGADGPLCLLSGGETTVTVTGPGKGGRNMELALAFAAEIDGISGITLLSAGTDGIDGPTDAAGAFADGETAARGRAKGLDPARSLADNDSYGFFREGGGLFVTGPTGTNVMDLQIVILE